MNLLDIIHIHELIVQQFESVIKNIHKLTTQAKEIETRLDSHDKISDKTRQTLVEQKAHLEHEIQSIETNADYHFYLFHAIPLIEQYKELVQTPMRISFMNSHRLQYQKDTIYNKKKAIVLQYIELIKKYKFHLKPGIIPDVYLKDFTNIEDDTITSICTCTNTNICDVCSDTIIKCAECNMADFDIDGNLFTCTHCGVLLDLINATSCIKDIERINISSKYTYDRRSHFKECIDQFQAKQNQNVPDKVFDDLYHQIRIHNLEDGDDDTAPQIRYQRLNKEHIQMFLKELNYTKFYEDIIYIYHKITNKPPDDISNIESKLMEDFDILTEQYDKKYKSSIQHKRKNFINIQCILYQLLLRHGYKCKRSDFNILKTIDKKYVHEDIISDLFKDLSWNFYRI